MLILSKAIYRFNAIFIEFPMTVFIIIKKTETLNSQGNFEKAGGITLLDFKLYNNQTVWYCKQIKDKQKKITTDTQTNEIEQSPGINSYIYGQQMFDNYSQYSKGKRQFA